MDEQELLQFLLKENGGNYKNAILQLGHIYCNPGIYGKVQQDYDKARQCYKKAAALGSREAIFNLGCLYYNGNGVPINHVRAKKYFEELVQSNWQLDEFYNANTYYIGKIYYITGNYMKAKEYFEKAIQLPNPYARYWLGYMYYFGKGITPDYIKARKYFELSSCNNNAKFYLACIYFYGLGCQQNFDRARQYYESYIHGIEYTQDQHLPQALFYLGYIYEKGCGVPQDYTKAKIYYEQSVSLNESNAMNNLGTMYYYGYGVEQDHMKAKQYYEQAAALENPYAIYNLGYMYEQSNKLRTDYVKAKTFYERAAKLGRYRAMHRLGHLYEEKQDYMKAKELYEKAVTSYNLNHIMNIQFKKNNLDAEIDLANLLTSGNVPPDPERGIYLYLKVYRKSGNCLDDIHRVLYTYPYLIKHVNEYINKHQYTHDLQEYNRMKELQLQITYVPGGCGYIEAKQNFDLLNGTTSNHVFNETTSNQVLNETTTNHIFNETTSNQILNETVSNHVFNETTSSQILNETVSNHVFNETTSSQVPLKISTRKRTYHLMN